LYKKSGKVCVLVSADDTVSVILSSGTEKVDCKDVLSKVLSNFGGRGGGKPDFAQGGVADPMVSKAIYSALMGEVARRLQLFK
jgi:alanyl-tRNA synthetase